MQTHSTTEAYRPNHDKKRWYQQLYFWVLLAIIIGVLLGWLSPSAGVAMEPIGTTFVTAMKMLIGPIVFLTIVGGIASVADLKKVGLTGIKALTYFQVGTILAMIFGLVAINIFRVGDGVNADACHDRDQRIGAEADHHRRDQAVVGVHHPPGARQRGRPVRRGRHPADHLPGRAVRCRAQRGRSHRRPGPGPDQPRHQDRVQDPQLRHEAGAAGRVRGDGVRDRQVRGVHADQPGRPDRAVLRHLGAVRVRGPRLGHGLPAAQHLAHAAATCAKSCC